MSLPLSAKFADGIDGSGWLAVVLSKHSVNSPWVQKKLNAALTRELRDESVFVLPIVIDDCEIPLFALDELFADFKDPYERRLDALLIRLLDGVSFAAPELTLPRF